MKKIKSLEVVKGEDSIVFRVGQCDVTSIVDNSIDAPQNYTAQYSVYIDNKLKHTFVNGIFEIEFN